MFQRLDRFGKVGWRIDVELLPFQSLYCYFDAVDQVRRRPDAQNPSWSEIFLRPRGHFYRYASRSRPGIGGHWLAQTITPQLWQDCSTIESPDCFTGPNHPLIIPRRVAPGRASFGQFAEFSFVHQGNGLEEVRAGGVLEADLEGDLALLDGVDHLVTFGPVDAERSFGLDVVAGGGKVPAAASMSLRSRGFFRSVLPSLRPRRVSMHWLGGRGWCRGWL